MYSFASASFKQDTFQDLELRTALTIEPGVINSSIATD
ncbi:MAG: hypothetical protein H0V35_02390 [Nitrospira sp.]|nr:hypothetical protein [Nitrospira sp.]